MNIQTFYKQTSQYDHRRPTVVDRCRPLYSVPHEESRKMFLFIVHFASFLQNQLSYEHVLCTTMIPYLP